MRLRSALRSPGSVSRVPSSGLRPPAPPSHKRQRTESEKAPPRAAKNKNKKSKTRYFEIVSESFHTHFSLDSRSDDGRLHNMYLHRNISSQPKTKCDAVERPRRVYRPPSLSRISMNHFRAGPSPSAVRAGDAAFSFLRRPLCHCMRWAWTREPIPSISE